MKTELVTDSYSKTKSVFALADQQEIVRRVAGLFALADQIEARLAGAQRQVDALKRLQAETAVNNMGQAAAELNALLPAILDKDIRTGIDSTS
jgi:hypothetical protein